MKKNEVEIIKSKILPLDDRAILALDLGTQTGWAVRSRDRIVTSGTVSFKTDRFSGGGMRYLRFANWLDELQRLVGRDIGGIFRGG